MRYGYDNDAAADYVRFQNYSAEVSADISDMFYFAAWAAANERKGYGDDAAAD